jgi:hypothetical protein
MCTLRSDFSQAQMNKVLRELCSEARQRIWEKEPDFMFEVGGKKLCKNVKIN